MAIVFGVDQSYTSTGIVIAEDGEMLNVRIIESDPSQTTFERAWDIACQLEELVAKFKPDLVAMEGLAYGMSGNATRDLAGLQFVIYTHLTNRLGQAVVVATPSELKKLATGKGKATKDEMVAAVPAHDLSVLKGTTNPKGRTVTKKQVTDLADAYWLAIYAETYSSS